MARTAREVIIMRKKNEKKFMEVARKNVEKDMILLKKLAKH